MSDERGVEVVDAVTGELVPAGESGLAFAEVLDDAGIASYLTDMNATEDDSPEAIQLEIARRILNAENEADLWAATTVMSAKDVQYQPLRVENVRWVKSAYEGGAPKFAIIDGVLINSDARVTVSCGAMNVVLMLYKLQKFGSLPATVQITSKPSSSDPGRTVYGLTPVAG